MAQKAHEKNQIMNILAIDTSCDDTSAAITQGRVVLSNIISSQHEIHQQWGGVVPILAKRAHQERIDAVIEKAMQTAKVTKDHIDAIAVTYGPGLSISLEVGVKKAKELAALWNKALIAVNHMEGHLFSAFALPKTIKVDEQNIQFPLLALLVSGGHTELVLAKDFGVYEILGQTLDDAAGEAFDKVARMLGLGYPGGAVLAKMAEDGDEKAYQFPLPLAQRKDLAFSYSGIKTAAFRLITSITKEGTVALTKQQIADIAASFQHIAIKHLVKRTEQALKNTKVRALVLGGGVSANILLRKALRTLTKKYGIAFYYPKTKNLHMDNAAMIGVAGYYKAQRGEFVKDVAKLDRDPTVEISEKGAFE